MVTICAMIYKANNEINSFLFFYVFKGTVGVMRKYHTEYLPRYHTNLLAN